MSNSSITPMPDTVRVRNGCHERCDAAVGPCACGAWHSLKDWAPEIQILIEASVEK
jgi:hypothetical protein